MVDEESHKLRNEVTKSRLGGDKSGELVTRSLRCAALPAVALAKAGLYSLNAALSLFISLLRF